MSYYNSDSAYDLSYFDDEILYDDQEENEIERKYNEHKEKQRKNEEAKLEKKQNRARTYSRLKVFIYVTLILGVVGACCARLTYLSAINNELNNKIAVEEARLQEAVSENTQLEMKIESILSPTVIEEYATNVLGMVKIDDSKKEYIRLDESDKVVLTEGESGDYLSNLINNILSCFD